MSDPIFDPLRKHLDRNLRKYLIGKTLGFCPRTSESIDIRTAVFVLDPQGDPYMALSQRGWAEVVQSGVLPDLDTAGYRVDPSTIKDPELREMSEVALGREPEPEVPEISPDQQPLF